MDMIYPDWQASDLVTVTAAMFPFSPTLTRLCVGSVN